MTTIPAPSTKVCRLCKKDVSNTKRVKDLEGHYYCAPCHETALKKTAAAGGGATVATNVSPKVIATGTAPAAQVARDDEYDLAPAPTPKPKAVAPAGDEYDLKSEPEVKKAARPAAAVAPVAAAAGAGAAAGAAPAKAKIPEFCPNCGTKTLPNRKLCFKCNRDVTKMDKLIEMREAAANDKEGQRAEKIATVVGMVTKVILIFVAVGAVAFSLYGIYFMFFPGGPFDHYPKTRQDAAVQFMQYIADGTDKSRHKAFLLVDNSTKMRSNKEEEGYKALFEKINEDFKTRHGANWASKMQITADNPSSTDEITTYTVKIDDKQYTLDVSVQQDLASNTLAQVTLKRNLPKITENGKWHFGVAELEEYPFDGKGKADRMHDMAVPEGPVIIDTPTGPKQLAPAGGEDAPGN